MAVAHDAVSESHTGTTGSSSEASFSWTHTPVGTPRGVLVFVLSIAASDNGSEVTYGGVPMFPVSGGTAADTSTEPGTVKAFFLGNNIPTGAQTVKVTRTNNATVMYAVCMTQTALSDTAPRGVVLLQQSGTGAYSEQSVDDGSPGTNSLRYAGGYWGGDSVVPAGANSTSLADIDLGSFTFHAVRETTAGQGARSVGLNSSGSTDDRAGVHLAIKEVTRVQDFSDNFDDNSLDTAKWNTDNALSGTVSETNQRIEATPANSTDNSQAGLISDNFFSFYYSSCQVEVVQAADTTNVFTDFELYSDANNYIGIGVGNGNFEFIQSVGGSFSTPFSTAYNASVHKFWRLREAYGSIFADYSTDGVTWVNFYTASNPLRFDAMKVRIFAIEHTPDATPGTAIFDNLNITTAGTGIDNLTDNFNDNSIDTAKWTSYTENSGVVSETNQELQFDLANATSGSWAGLYSDLQYNLTGKRVSVKVPASTGTGNSFFDLTLSMEQMGIVDNFFSIGINFNAQTIEAVLELGGDDFVLTSTAYTNTTDYYISMRESGGTIYWEYSTNGTDWTELYNHIIFPGIPITNLYVVLDDYEFNSATNPNVHKFDDFNILPAAGTAVKDMIGMGFIPYAR